MFNTITKRTIFAIYSILVATMGVATFVESSESTCFAHSHIYGTTWFTILWALLAGTGTIYFVASRIRNAATVLLHLSFLVILAGALATHLLGHQGFIHLRIGDKVNMYYVSDMRNGMHEAYLPFYLELTSFKVKRHSGTETASDYESLFRVIDGVKEHDARVSMNNIFSYRSYRMYQSSFDPDMRGSILAINHDPVGIPVTYAGYALLFLSLIWMLFDPRGTYRKILQSDVLRKGIIVIAVIFAGTQVATAASVLPRDSAKKIGNLYILHNDRICPLQTFAIDFTKELHGKAKYKGFTAEQVLTGFMFFADEWSNEPVMRIKGKALRKELGLPEYVSPNSLFARNTGSYILGPYVQGYFNGNHSKPYKEAVEADNCLQLVMELARGSLLRIFPITNNGETTWYSPADELPAGTDTLHAAFISNVLRLMGQEARNGNYNTVNELATKMSVYQVQNAGRSLPTLLQTRAEKVYNAVPFATVLFIVNLTMGVLSLIYIIYKSTHGITPCKRRIATNVQGTIMGLSFLALTFCLALRWVISGTVPMTNGYETMLTIAWVIMAAALLLSHKFNIIITFGYILSGLFLLVSHISQMTPQISHVMPVLSSPLLSLHVSVIMISFSLLSFTFICGVTALIVNTLGRGSLVTRRRIAALQVLSQLFLYPAMSALGIGIFVGAIWANVSWGTYWSWDPKEVWALITFMVYALAFHRHSFPTLGKPMAYHAYMLFAFLTILMTFFGVNYILGGMHSYA